MLPLDQLHELFPLPCHSFMTQGMELGVVLKFHTFYLKIYDDPQSQGYIVQGFLYGKQNPVIIDQVKWTQMRKYAQQYTKDDHLHRLLEIHKNNHYGEGT